MPQRTFLALDIDEVTLGRLTAAADGLDLANVKARRVRPENLHVTLNFLGDVDDARIDEICRAAGEAAAQTEPFEFTIGGLLCVPPHGPLRMIWAGVDDPGGRMAELQDRLAAALETLGFARERRPFKPHLTVARIKFSRDASAVRASAAESAETEFGVVQAKELTVYASRLTPAGPVYSPLSRAALGGG